MKIFVVLITILVILISCEKHDFTIDNLNNDEIIILGHGGMGIGQTYPMNSFESILRCINTGADGSEIDVQLTKDSVLVAYHDKNLSDNTNISGMINDLNWDEIKDAYYTNTPYLNYSILSLEQLFANIDNLKNYNFTLDCKLYTNNNVANYQKIYVNSLSKIIKKYELMSNIYIESQNAFFLNRLQNEDKDYKLFIYPGSFEEGLSTSLDMGLYGITLSTDMISKEQIEEAHMNNLFVAIWNTHSKSKNIEAVNKNPDIIQTDKVAHLVNLLD